MKEKIKAGIVGGAGYTGGELLRILLYHPSVSVEWVSSVSQQGKIISAVHADLLGDTSLKFINEPEILDNIDVIFLCSGHGDSKKFLERTKLPGHLKIIDLSTDFRDESEGFIYGLPELQRARIKSARKIANPGCFATSIILGLLPLAEKNLLTDDIHVSAITGSTGAGQALSATTHFTWRNNNVSVYKALSHQHLTEIGRSIQKLQPTPKPSVYFVPYRGDYTRGIMANAYTDFSEDIDQANALYEDFYKDHPFTFVSREPVNLKQVVNTNKCLIYLEKHGNKLLISSILDNLLKGASGQATQNMNLIFDLAENDGLRLKASAF